MLTVNGVEVAGEVGTYPVYNPVRPAEVVTDAPAASPGQVDAAVQAAAAAVPAWAALPLEDRSALLAAAAAAVQVAPADQCLAELLTRENGKILAESQLDVAGVAAIVATFTELASAALAPRPTSGGGELTREPVGVVGALLPFNWPVSVLATKVAPALLAGNTMVVKPPPTCPTAVLRSAAAMARALPPGVLNTVNGPGPEVGQVLAAHRGVGMLSLTGGVVAGRAVMAAAAERVTPVLLELGGNDAAIIAPDVEITDEIARRLLDAAFVTSGQVCVALKRLYVPARRLDQVVEALLTGGAESVVGDGLDPGTTLGPLHTAPARARAEGLLAEAAERGAAVHRTGRVRPEDAQAGGHLVAPTVVADPPPDTAIVAEEQFAPVLPVIGYENLDEAVVQANSVPHGLGASVWSHDDELAARLARCLEAGVVFRNGHGPLSLDPSVPFGGWKQSGFGREYGVEGVVSYTRSRAVLAGPALPGGTQRSRRGEDA
jgi:acyl-CoA reductase-like NAD-dependent aldehyde dehydrogenase